MDDRTSSVIRIAPTVAELASSAGAKPKGLIDALAVYDAAVATDVTNTGIRPDVAGAALTLKAGDDLATFIESVAAFDAVAPHRLPAKSELLDALARRVLRETQVAAPAAFDACAEPFNAAASAFTDAYRTLPRRLVEIDFSPGDVVRAGSAVLEAIEACNTANAELNTYLRLRDILAGLGVKAKVPTEYDTHTRYCAPPDRATAETLRYATWGNRWRPWQQLLELGLELKWQTLANQEAMAAGYIAELPARGRRLPRQDHAWA